MQVREAPLRGSGSHRRHRRRSPASEAHRRPELREDLIFTHPCFWAKACQDAHMLNQSILNFATKLISRIARALSDVDDPPNGCLVAWLLAWFLGDEWLKNDTGSRTPALAVKLGTPTCMGLTNSLPCPYPGPLITAKDKLIDSIFWGDAT